MKLETIFEKKILEIKSNFKNKLAAAIIAVTIWSGKISEERNGPATEIEKESWKLENEYFYFIESEADSILQSENWQNFLGNLILECCPEPCPNFPNLNTHYQQVLKVNPSREITVSICSQILAKIKYPEIQESVKNNKKLEKNLFLLEKIIRRIMAMIAENQTEILERLKREITNKNSSLITHNK